MTRDVTRDLNGDVTRDLNGDVARDLNGDVTRDLNGDFIGSRSRAILQLTSPSPAASERDHEQQQTDPAEQHEDAGDRERDVPRLLRFVGDTATDGEEDQTEHEAEAGDAELDEEAQRFEGAIRREVRGDEREQSGHRSEHRHTPSSCRSKVLPTLPPVTSRSFTRSGVRRATTPSTLSPAAALAMIPAFHSSSHA